MTYLEIKYLRTKKDGIRNDCQCCDTHAAPVRNLPSSNICITYHRKDNQKKHTHNVTHKPFSFRIVFEVHLSYHNIYDTSTESTSLINNYLRLNPAIIYTAILRLL